jgi:outer membrane protein insertion porin family
VLIDLSSELAREGRQDRGYFMAQVNGDAKVLMSNAISQRLAVNFEVNEGQQYRFGEITFKGNKAIKDEALRAFFPITSGEMFSRKQMAAGLENLNTAYDELGYLNFIPIPNPTVDDESGNGVI